MSEERRGVEERIRALCRRRAERIRQRDAEAMVPEFYARDARLMPAGEPEIRGREKIRRWWRERPDAGLLALTLQPGEVKSSGDLAYEIGRFERTVRPRHGPPRQDHGKYLVVYRREPDGEFRAVAEMYNSD